MILLGLKGKENCFVSVTSFNDFVQASSESEIWIETEYGTTCVKKGDIVFTGIEDL